METAELIRKLELTDIGKLLLMFEGAKKAKVGIDEVEAESIAFLLTERREVPFSYDFLLNPMPVSTQLRQDLDYLLESQYLKRGSPVHISHKGSDWVSATLGKLHASEDSLNSLAQMLTELIVEYRRHAFDLIYTAISG